MLVLHAHSQVIHPSLPLQVGGTNQSNGTATNAATYLETLITPTARLNVLTQVQDSRSNPVIVTINDKGAFHIFLQVPELGWISPRDGMLLTATNFQFPGETMSVPLLDFIPTKHYSAIPSTNTYSTGVKIRESAKLNYPDGNTLLTSDGKRYFLERTLLFNPQTSTYYWAGNRQMFTTGDNNVRYPGGNSLYSSSTKRLRYSTFATFSKPTQPSSLFFVDGTNSVFVSAAVNRLMSYPPALITTNSLGLFSTNGLAHLFYPNAQKLKEEQQPFVGKVYREDGIETNTVLTRIPYAGGEVGIHAAAVSDFIYILQTESSAETQVSHVILQNRFHPALPAPQSQPDGSAQISWMPPEAFKNYQLQYSTNLMDWFSPAVWIKNPTSTEQAVIWSDTNAVSSQPERFYRLLLPAN